MREANLDRVRVQWDNQSNRTSNFKTTDAIVIMALYKFPMHLKRLVDVNKPSKMISLQNDCSAPAYCLVGNPNLKPLTM